MTKLRLVVASKNNNKITEIQSILADLPIDVQAIDQLVELPEIVEDGNTFEENAIKKAVEAGKVADQLVVADDSGLVVKYLKGAPGVFSARYAGVPTDDLRNNEKLLAEMKNVPWEDRDAEFHCVIAIADPNGTVQTCTGVCAGKIGYQLRGKHGFGYDPLFVLPQYDNQTFAELDPAIKNRISHRAEALVQLKQLLRQKIK